MWITLSGRLTPVLRSPLSPRLLKKVHMQGGAPGTHP